MRRRTLLTAVGAGSLALAGCLGDSDAGGPETEPGDGSGTDEPNGGTTTDPGTTDGDGTTARADLPEACPTSQDLDVEWPADLDAETVASFVEAYEAAYYREVVVDYEPETPFASYELSGSVSGAPQSVDGGWTVTYSGSGGVYRGPLMFDAEAAEPPADADVVPAGEIDDARITSVVEAAAEGDEGDGSDEHVTDADAVNRYVDLLPSLSEDFEELTEIGDEDSLYVDVDGTVVELTVYVSNLHGDYWWEATYYVDEHVVRRIEEGEDTDPRDGTLLECRTDE